MRFARAVLFGLGLGLACLAPTPRASAADGPLDVSTLVARSLWEPRLRDIVSDYESDAFRLAANRSESFRAFFWPKFEPAGPRDRDLRQLFGKANVVITYRRDRDEIRYSVDPANVKGAAFFRDVGALFAEAVVPASFERYDGQRGTVAMTPDKVVATFAPIERWPLSAARPVGAHTIVVFGANRAPTRFEEYDSRGRLIETREYTHVRARDGVAVQSYTLTPASIDPAADRRTMRLFYGQENEGDVFPERLEYVFTKRGLGPLTIRFLLRGLDRTPF